MRPSYPTRRGITILEVLIALGILAIGLASVAAIIPAARSQANRAVILDRAALHAANVLADAATFGVLRRSGTNWQSITASSPTVVIDALPTGLDSTTTAQARTAGVFATSTSGAAVPSVARLFLDSRDDVIITTPTNDDNLPLNLVIDGARAFAGRTTSLLCLSDASSGLYRASVVVFHNRDQANTTITGTLADSELTITPPSGRTASDIARPGVVLWEQSGRRFHQLTAVASTANGSAFYVGLGSGTSIASGTFTVQILPDSVGLAERVFTPETAGGFVP
jgi:Tfp pilus assembly protein PilV